MLSYLLSSVRRICWYIILQASRQQPQQLPPEMTCAIKGVKQQALHLGGGGGGRKPSHQLSARPGFWAPFGLGAQSSIPQFGSE